MISVEHLAVRAGNFELRDICLEVPDGQYAVLMGKTGSGKTTLLEALCGLKPIHHGTVRLDGREVTRLKPAERGIGYVPQDRALFRTMTVQEHLAFALTVRRAPRGEIERRVAELARLLGLEALLDRKPGGLSGGEAQRVALGRALAAQPAILCLDEPLNALDDETRLHTQEVLRNVQRNTGVTILHVTHNLDEAEQLADAILLLRDGQVQYRS